MEKVYYGVKSVLTPVDYIQCTGTESVDIDYYANQDTKVEMKVQFTTNNQEALFACRELRTPTPTNTFTTFKLSGSSLRTDYYVTGSNYTYSMTIGTDYVYTMDKGNAYMNGTLIHSDSSTPTFTVNHSMQLFASEAANFATYKFYYFKVWDNGTLVRHLVPMLCDDSRYCLYDKVSGSVFFSNGTGNFIGGTATGEPDITVERARHIRKVYVGVSGDVAKKTKKAYIGKNNVAQRTLIEKPKVYKLYSATSIGNISFSKAGNYFLRTGTLSGSGITEHSPVYAISKSFVETQITNLSSYKMRGAFQSIGEYGVYAGGMASTYQSSSSVSTTVDAYNASLVKTTATQMSGRRYQIYGMSNSTHLVIAGGGTYTSTPSNIVDSYSTSLVKTQCSNLSTQKQHCGLATVGDYIVVAGGAPDSASSAAYSSVEAYNNNNVKTTCTSLPANRCEMGGSKDFKYAVFLGGGATQNGSFSNQVVYYNDSLVQSYFTGSLTTSTAQYGTVNDKLVVGLGRGRPNNTWTVQTIMDVYSENMVREDTLTNMPSVSYVFNACAVLDDTMVVGTSSNQVMFIE